MYTQSQIIILMITWQCSVCNLLKRCFHFPTESGLKLEHTITNPCQCKRNKGLQVYVTYLNLTLHIQTTLTSLVDNMHSHTITDITYHSKCNSGLPLRYIVLSSKCYPSNFCNTGSTNSTLNFSLVRGRPNMVGAHDIVVA